MVMRCVVSFMVAVWYLAAGQAQDAAAVYQREKADFLKSPASQLYAPSLFKKLDALEAQIKASTDASQTALLIQQARWLLPDASAPVPSNVSRIMGTVKFKHDQYAQAIVYSPDEKSIYTTSRDGTVRQWDLLTGKSIKAWDMKVPLGPMCLSPDGKQLAVAEGYRLAPHLDLATLPQQEQYAVHLIDLTTGTVQKKLTDSTAPVLCLGYSADGQLLAAGTQSGKAAPLLVWNLAAGKLERSIKGIHAIQHLAWSKDASKIYVTNSDRSIAVFDSKTGLQVFANARERGMIYAMALSPDQSMMAIGGDLTDEANTIAIKIYSTKDWKLLQTLIGHQNSIVSLTFHAGGNLLVSASAKPEAAIKVWNIAQKSAVTQYLGHTNDILGVAITASGHSLATISLDGSIRQWQTSQVKPPKTLFQGKAPIWCLATNDTRYLAVGADQSAILRDLTTGKEVQKYTEHQAAVTAGCFRHDGAEIATGGAGDFAIRLWDTATGKTNATLKGHTGVITALIYSPDGKRLYSASADKTIRIWNLADKKQLFKLDQHRSVVTSLALNLEGTLLASGGADNIIRIWRTHDASELRSLIGHVGAITGLAYSPGGNLLASVGADGITKIWDPSTRSDPLRTLSGHTGQLMAVAFSPNHKFLATAGADATIRIWNMNNGSEMRALQGHSDWVTSLAFLGDSEGLLSASVDGSIKLWTESKAFEPLVFGHDQPINYLAMTFAGDLLASGSDEGRILLWNPETGEEQGSMSNHQVGIKALAFSNDGKRLVSADRDLYLKLWEVPARREVQSFLCKSDGIHRLAFLQGDRGVIGSTGSSNVAAWKLEERLLTPEPALSFLGYERHCNAVTFARDRVAMGSTDGKVKLWKINGLKNESDAELQAYQVAVHELTLSSDGKRLLTTNQENEFKLWDLENRKQVHSWTARPAKLRALAMDATGTRVLAAFENNEIVLWDTATGRELRSWKFLIPMNDLIFSPRAKQAFAASAHGVLYRLDLP